MARLEARILGCGSSGGVPRVGNDWGVCDPAEPRNRRSRCSLLLRYRESGAGEATMALIDTSPDLREQLLAARVDRLDGVLLSHEHADQCHGIDDLRALAIRHRKRLQTWMDASTAAVIGRRFDYCFENQAGYPAILERRDMVAGKTMQVEGPGGPMTILPLSQDHGFTSSLGFRIGDFAYCNDVVRLPDETLGRLEGLDIVVLDALRYAEHPTHASVRQALAWVSQLKPRRAILTNLHVDLDYATLRAELPEGVEPAFDGMELRLGEG